MVLSFTVLGGSLMYTRNSSGPKTDPWGHHQLFFPMHENSFDLILHLKFELSYICYEGKIQTII